MAKQPAMKSRRREPNEGMACKKHGFSTKKVAMQNAKHSRSYIADFFKK